MGGAASTNSPKNSDTNERSKSKSRSSIRSEESSAQTPSLTALREKEKIDCDYIFIDQVLHDAAVNMMDDEAKRYDFVDFVKSGLWVSKLYHYEVGGKGSVNCNPPTLTDLKISEREAAVLEAFFGRIVNDSSQQRSGAMSPTSTAKSGNDLLPPRDRWQTIHAEDYEVDLNDRSKQCIPLKYLLPVLFNIVYPIYLETKAADFTSTSPQSSSDSTFTPGAATAAAIVTAAARGESAATVDCLSISPMTTPRMRKTHHSRVAQKLLTAVAAYFDESMMLDSLKSIDWLDETFNAIEGCNIAVSICDARASGFPILYVNKAMTRMTRFSRQELIGGNFKCLQGPETSDAQLRTLANALKQAKPLKLALANYTKQKKKFLNLLTIKPVFDSRRKYTYVIGIHFEVKSNGSGKVDDVRAVNDLAAVLPHMIKFPTVETGPGGVDGTLAEAAKSTSDSGKFAPRASFVIGQKSRSHENLGDVDNVSFRKSLSDLGMVSVMSDDGAREDGDTVRRMSIDSNKVDEEEITHIDSSQSHRTDAVDTNTTEARASLLACESTLE